MGVFIGIPASVYIFTNCAPELFTYSGLFLEWAGLAAVAIGLISLTKRLGQKATDNRGLDVLKQFRNRLKAEPGKYEITGQAVGVGFWHRPKAGANHEQRIKVLEENMATLRANLDGAILNLEKEDEKIKRMLSKT